MKFQLRYFAVGIVFALLLGLYSCFSAVNKSTLVVAIASSLTDVMAEVRTEFQAQYPDISIQFNTAASGTLQRQIEQRAPIDIFASAALEPIQSLVQKDFISPESIRIFAQNQLVLIQTKDSKPRLKTLTDLGVNDVQKIAMGNPKTVPAGKYTANLLEKYPQLYQQLQKGQKIVFAENVRQVLTYVQNQAVVAGFVYRTDILQQSDLEIIESFPEALIAPIVYAIAPIKASPSPTQAQLFIDFVLGEQGQIILQRYGFLSPKD